jgi:hypothetical protein
MKKAKFRFLPMLSALLLAMACEQQYPTESENIQAEDGYLKSMAEDSLFTDVPDVVIDDTILQDHALVSQYCENFLTYTYDRWGRLDYINYFRRLPALQLNDAACFPGHVYMRDKFVYGNTGRLVELLRYSSIFTDNTCPSATNLIVLKTYIYNATGQLAEIHTRRPNNQVTWEKVEYLYYDRSGNMVRRLVKLPDHRPYAFSYLYDKSNRLVRITGYNDENTCLRFVCNLYYDNRNNIERKEFYYPSPLATSAADMIRKWVVFYKHDRYNNPFYDFRLPVSSLFEWMDIVSPSNITAISFENDVADRAVFYRYRYNNLGYPVVRYRINLLATDE